jgi:radical SAM superfamily enzyme YgiQ (UPF0313 family)
MPPVSSLAVSSHLENKGFETIIFDMRLNSNEELEKYISENKDQSAFAGLTVFVGSYILAAREITAMVKKYGIRVLWGGPLVDVLPDLCEKECDAICGPMPYDKGFNWRKIEMSKKQEPFLAYLFTSVGCPYRCTFCYLQSYKKKVVLRSVETVIEEMDRINNDFGITEFGIGDDNFFTNAKRSVQILNQMKNRGYTVSKVIGAQRNFTSEVLDVVMGVVKTVIFSLEAASEEIIERIKKPVDLKRAVELNKIFGQNGVSVYHNIIFGWPFEKADDRKKANSLFEDIKSVNSRFRGIIYLYTSLPGTTLTKEVEADYGSFPDNLDFWVDCEFESSDATLKYRPWLTTSTQKEIAAEMENINRRFNIIPD